MNRIELIKRGYFAKELPPCFTSETFADQFDSVMNEANSRNVKGFFASVTYTIPKVGFARRELKIPNPFPQGRLVQITEQHYGEIKQTYDKSKISLTIPTPSGADEKRAVTHIDYGKFKENCVLASYHKHVQLRMDISKFYHSIYTHSVAWTTEGKQAYKKNRARQNNDPEKRKVDLFSDEIDKCLQNCQSQQTKGIPIGPDTSLVVAELIGCHIDYLAQIELKKKKIDYVGYRFYDDYYLYFDTQLEAEITIDIFEKILADFELDLNYEKTRIQTNIFIIDNEWKILLNSFQFRKTADEQRKDIWNFFALAFQYTKNNPLDSVLKFAVGRFFNVRINRENWDMFEALLLKVGFTETATLEFIARILVSYKTLVNKKRIKEFAFGLIKRHCIKNHDYELTWALWLLKQFRITVTKDIFELVFQTTSVTAIIIGLDLWQKERANVNLDSVVEKISPDNLVTQFWLLTYESLINGWVPNYSSDLLATNPFFSILKEKSVSFYDSNRSLQPISFERKVSKTLFTKVNAIEKSMNNLKGQNESMRKSLEVVTELVNKNSKIDDQPEIRDNLSNAEKHISAIIQQLAILQERPQPLSDTVTFNNLSKNLTELQELTVKEIKSINEIPELLFDPMYE